MGCASSTEANAVSPQEPKNKTRTVDGTSKGQTLPIYGSAMIMNKKRHGTSATPVQTNLRWGCDFKTADKICNYNRHYGALLCLWLLVCNLYITCMYIRIRAKHPPPQPKVLAISEERKGSSRTWKMPSASWPRSNSTIPTLVTCSLRHPMDDRTTNSWLKVNVTVGLPFEMRKWIGKRYAVWEEVRRWVWQELIWGTTYQTRKAIAIVSTLCRVPEIL